ncbi:cytochrome P450 [Zopfia rhizophila CBS 207.26]|uniref:Cytochrome P450 n=1 Tax=Zopfia rhizophila CBS 207.26 TaxID=1314779 RepID=A0A6A6ETY0_9PEZI|nr:cytochrome P450 [Zopfia rhizophila CBS 207.26]
MFHFLLTVTPDTNLPAFSHDHLLSEARLLVLAGTDTSTMTLCGVFFYLTHDPRVLAKLTEEIRSIFFSAEKIVQGIKLSKCKHLRACIDETLRMAPPAPANSSTKSFPAAPLSTDITAYRHSRRLRRLGSGPRRSRVR